MRFLAEFRIAADPAEVRELRRAVRQRLEPIGLRGPDLDRLILVIDEIVNNAIEHGEIYRADGDVLQVRVLVDRSGGVELEFRDPSVPPEVVDSIRRQLDYHGNGNGMPPMHNERGRGLFLIADAFDCMFVERSSAGLGLVLRGTMRRDPA